MCVKQSKARQMVALTTCTCIQNIYTGTKQQSCTHSYPKLPYTNKTLHFLANALQQKPTEYNVLYMYGISTVVIHTIPEQCCTNTYTWIVCVLSYVHMVCIQHML